MTPRGESLFHAFATALAERLSRHSANREAEYLSLVSVIYAQAAAIFGGERIYGPQTNRVEREQARARIARALLDGESPAQIARRENVSERHVRKVRGTIRP